MSEKITIVIEAKVSSKLLRKDGQAELAGYIHDALSTWGGQRRSDDVLFHGVRPTKISVRKEGYTRNLFVIKG